MIGAESCLITLMATGMLYGQTSTHTYHATSAVIANPERGWYDDYYSYSGGSNLGTAYRPLKAKELIENREKDNITLILRLFYLHEFLELDDVSPEYLARMQSDFDSIRAAGVKCNVLKGSNSEVHDAPPPHLECADDSTFTLERGRTSTMRR